jgi:hypothetical protein
VTDALGYSGSHGASPLRVVWAALPGRASGHPVLLGGLPDAELARHPGPHPDAVCPVRRLSPRLRRPARLAAVLLGGLPLAGLVEG